MLYLANVYFGTSIGGLMAPEYIDAPWSWAKVKDVLAHLWIPVVVIGTSGTAGMIRRLRANLLDELQKQYVTTARAKGLPPGKLMRKYPLRIAMNFFVADVGNLLPQVISGAEIVAVVMSLPTTGPMLLAALQSQDMYLAGTFLMFLAVLTVVGVLVSDLALAALDPRVRLQGKQRLMDKNEHYVSDAPFDPKSIEQLTPEQEKVYLASQWQLMWWKLKRHRLAVVSGLVLLCMYVSILFVEIISPYNLHTGNDDATYAPPQRVHLFHEGEFVGPFVYDRNVKMNMETFLRQYTEDTSEPKPIRCLLYTSPSPRDRTRSRMPSSA